MLRSTVNEFLTRQNARAPPSPNDAATAILRLMPLPDFAADNTMYRIHVNVGLQRDAFIIASELTRAAQDSSPDSEALARLVSLTIAVTSRDLLDSAGVSKPGEFAFELKVGLNFLALSIFHCTDYVDWPNPARACRQLTLFVRQSAFFAELENAGIFNEYGLSSHGLRTMLSVVHMPVYNYGSGEDVDTNDDDAGTDCENAICDHSNDSDSSSSFCGHDKPICKANLAILRACHMAGAAIFAYRLGDLMFKDFTNPAFYTEELDPTHIPKDYTPRSFPIDRRDAILEMYSLEHWQDWAHKFRDFAEAGRQVKTSGRADKRYDVPYEAVQLADQAAEKMEQLYSDYVSKNAQVSEVLDTDSTTAAKLDTVNDSTRASV